MYSPSWCLLGEKTFREDLFSQICVIQIVHFDRIYSRNSLETKLLFLRGDFSFLRPLGYKKSFFRRDFSFTLHEKRKNHKKTFN